MTLEELLAMCANVVGTLGSDSSEGIESAMNDMVSIQSWIEERGAAEQILNEDVSNLNEKVTHLQAANNSLYRQLSTQQQAVEQAANDLTDSAKFQGLF